MGMRVLVGTDGSAAAERAVAWGAGMARSYGGELVLVEVVPPVDGDGGAEPGEAAADRLTRRATDLVPGHGQGLAIAGDDVAATLVEAAAEQHADVLVVGNAGMSGRREFLLGNVPNRVSHQARCTVCIVNTVLPAQNGATPAHDDAAIADAEPGMLTPRALRIARVLGMLGWQELAARRHHAEPDETGQQRRAAEVRHAFEELGPTFCKLGQVLSTRPDLLPPAYVGELASLQDRVPPMPESDVVRVMEQELGVPWEDVFDSIDPVPLAAGTIAQVHRAVLTTGDRVVVKVQRPTARAEIVRDLALLETVATASAARPALSRVADVPALYRHLAASLERELDFRIEADNLVRMRTLLAPFPRLAVPRLHSECSTGRLLVMEEIDGVPVAQAPVGPERSEAARQLVACFYHQILGEGFFHADPHPGNLMWWRDRLYLLDCGMVGEVDPAVRDNLLLLLLAFWQEDAAFLSDVILAVAGDGAPRDMDIAAFREDVGALMGRHRHLAVREMQLGPILQEMTGIAVRHNVPLPTSLVLVGKSLAQVQLATGVLDPDVDPFSVVNDFLTRTTLRRLAQATSPRRWLYESQKLRLKLVRALEALERVTGARPGPPLQVEFRGTERLESRIQRAGRRIARSMAVAGGVIAIALIGTSSHPAPGWMLPVIGAVTAVLAFDLLVGVVVRDRRGDRG